MFWNKRGIELGYFEILDLILIVMVAGSFAVFLMNLNSDTYFERDFISKDISLFEHALYAGPGEIESYAYYSPVYRSIDIDTEDMFTYVLEKESKKLLPESVPFPESEFKKIDLSLFDIFFTTNIVEVAEKGLDNGVSYYAYNKQGFKDQTVSGKPTFTFKKSDNLEIITE